MLTLSRRIGERIVIGENIVLTIVDIDRGRVRIGIEAPKDVLILRGELLTDRSPEPPASGEGTK